jgi:manganese transport protein
VAEIQEAYQLLAPMLGAGIASTLFAVALLASGQNSTITATLAGQIVMEGFLDIRLPAWLRRLVTRLLAIVPAVIVAILYGTSGTAKLLVLSQVILSLQLPFAVVPLVRFTSDKAKMGAFANPLWLKLSAWAISALIIALNLKLLWDFFGG